MIEVVIGLVLAIAINIPLLLMVVDNHRQIKWYKEQIAELDKQKEGRDDKF